MRWQQALGWGVAVSAGVLALAAIRWLGPAHGARPSSAAAPVVAIQPVKVAGAASASRIAAVPTRPGLLAAAPPGASAPQAASDLPPGVSRAQWTALQNEMARRPDGPAELQRLADYFRYQDAVQRFRALREASPDAADLKPLAQQIEQGLPVHLQRSEVSATEAQLIEIAALQVLLPDDAARQQALAEWRQRVQQQQAPQAAQWAARTADFEREQAQIVTAWQALPANRRDPAQLQQQLQALRARSFPSPGS